MSSKVPQPEARRTRDRSPDYPAFNLREVINFVKMLYDKDKFSAIPTETAVKHMGYASLNGASRTALSAMRKFGLVTYSSGNVRLSELAHDIVLPRETVDRQKALSIALLHPGIYKQVLEEWPNWELPSEETIRSRLIRDWGFTQQGVSAFYTNLRESLDYVQTQVGTLPGMSTGPSLDLPDNSVDKQRPDTQNVSQLIDKDAPSLTEGRATQRLPMPKTDLYLLIWKEMTKEEARRIIFWLDHVVKPALKLASEDFEEE